MEDKKVKVDDLDLGEMCMCNKVGQCAAKDCFHRRKHEATKACNDPFCDAMNISAHCRKINY